MSAALFVLLLSVVGTKNALAQVQVATLQHQDNISAFYGANAFVQAHEAAESGDIITLSSGSFTPINITKAITLRGAGCVADPEAGTAATVINGAINMDVADTLNNFLSIEGILFPNEVKMGLLNSPTFTRCSFLRINDIGQFNHNMTDGHFIDCIIKEMSFYRALNTTMVNCVVWEPSYVYNSQPVVIYNSIFGGMTSQNTGLTAYNSIIIKQRGSEPSASCSFFNCIGINLEESNAFGTGYVSNCTTYDSYEEVFATFAGEFGLEEDFTLTEDAAAFMGTDGTQVGIYGSAMPYTSRPAYQVLKHTTVAPRSNVDGTLNVEIEVITEE